MKKIRSKKFWSSPNKNNHLKGKTYEEVYGKEKSDELKHKRRLKAKELGFCGSRSNKKALENGNHISQQPKIECEFCGILLTKTNYARWHGVKCRRKI